MNTKVIVVGGGVAGMSAAHELRERGFEVEIYEREEKYVGGKARSVKFLIAQRKAIYLYPENMVLDFSLPFTGISSIPCKESL